MTLARGLALAVLSAGVVTGTVADERILSARSARDEKVIEADFHVHAFPGDGSLPRWELQREAARRDLDAIAITNHNHVFAGRFGSFISGADVIVIAGQEITTPRFHLIAAGIRDAIDWRLPVRDAIAEIHRQGGVAIAAHPTSQSWRPQEDESLRELDGVEAAHPLMYFFDDGRNELGVFLNRVQVVKPTIAPIGSSDGHAMAGIGDCRTYVIVEERSEKGILDAIRRGRTIASDGRGTLIGDPELVRLVQQQLTAPGPHHRFGSIQTWAATSVLLALASVVILK
jgi:hypothetical protein